MTETLNLGSFSGHEVHPFDTDGTANSSVTITGFMAGTSGDKILLNEASTAGNTDITDIVIATTTGGTPAGAGINAASGSTSVYVAGSSAAQISGALMQTGDAGVAEASLIAAGIIISGSNIAAESFYYLADNGTATGIYRVLTVPLATCPRRSSMRRMSLL